MRFALLACLAAFTVVIGLCSSSAADGAAMSPQAAALWTEGQQLYHDGKYAEAIERFERGRALEPRAEFLYAAGQAARKAGDCRQAIELYRRYIVEADTAARIEAARLQISRCEEDLAAASPPTLPAQQSPVSPPAPVSPVRTETTKPWYRDTLGMTLLASGAIAVGVAALFVVRSRHGLDNDRQSYGEFEEALDTRKRDRISGIALGGLGGALLTGAVVRFAVWPERVEGGHGSGMTVSATVGARF